MPPKSSFHVVMGGGDTFISTGLRRDPRSGKLQRDLLPPHRLAKTMFIRNLPPTLTEANLIRLCAKTGEIERIQYMYHTSGPQIGQPRGFAFIEFKTDVDCQKTIEALHGYVYDTNTLVAQQFEQPDDEDFAVGESTFAALKRQRQKHQAGQGQQSAAIGSFNSALHDDLWKYIKSHQYSQDDEEPMFGLKGISHYIREYLPGELPPLSTGHPDEVNHQYSSMSSQASSSHRGHGDHQPHHSEAHHRGHRYPSSSRDYDSSRDSSRYQDSHHSSDRRPTREHRPYHDERRPNGDDHHSYRDSRSGAPHHDDRGSTSHHRRDDSRHYRGRNDEGQRAYNRDDRDRYSDSGRDRHRDYDRRTDSRNASSRDREHSHHGVKETSRRDHNPPDSIKSERGTDTSNRAHDKYDYSKIQY